MVFDTEAFIVASVAAFAFDLYVTHVLHQRYSQQFGISFVISGVVAFAPPCFLVIGFPLYCVLAAKILPIVRMGLLTLLFLLYIFAAFRLKRKILSKIFPKPVPVTKS